MTVLPILERELRVRARSRTNHWGRFAVGAAGILIALPPLAWSSPYITNATVGRGAFNGLVSGAMLLCCATCLLTADSISSERREGTLGLLLLTRVRNFEVLLGKLVSSGLASILGLTAFLPVLMLPLLAGGVTGAEAGRKALVLFDTVFLSLSAGLWASAGGSERFRTARAAILLVAGLVLGPVLLGAAFSKKLMLLSPIGAMVQAADSAFRTSPSKYWLSLGMVQVFAWALLALAMARLRGRWRGRHEARVPVAAAPVSVPADVACEQTGKCHYCGMMNEESAIYCVGCGTELRPQAPPDPWLSKPQTPSTAPTPLHWLLRRGRGQPMLWLAAIIACLQFVLFGLGSGFLGLRLGAFLGMSSTFGLAVAAVTGSLFAWVASRFFVEARRTGELELLATTPLGAEAIVPTQWSTLRSWIRGPVLLMLVPIILMALIVLGNGYGGWWRYYYALSVGLSGVNTVFRIGALCWVGMWCGLRADTQGRAILWTLLMVEAPPYAVSLCWSILYKGVIVAGTSPSPWILSWLVPPLASLLYFLWLISLARGQLRKEIAGAEPISLRQFFAAPWTHLAELIHQARQWPPV